MAHCGYEGTAVDDAFAHPIKALLTSLRGPRVTGPMAPELPILYGDRVRAAGGTVATVPVDAIKRAVRDTDGGHTITPR
jgi:hypothetical protein